MLPVQKINFFGFNRVQGLQFVEEQNLESMLFEAGSPLSADLAVNG
jgi:hypothetical protein